MSVCDFIREIHGHGFETYLQVHFCYLVQAVVQHFLLFSSLICVAVRVFGQETIEAGVVDENLRADEAKGAVHDEQVATAQATGKSEQLATIWKRM
jgi:hypothetical protein